MMINLNYELESVQRKQRFEKYQVPENCTDLYQSRLNQQIWAPLKPDVKASVKTLAALQEALQNALGGIAMSVEVLLK